MSSELPVEPSDPSADADIPPDLPTCPQCTQPFDPSTPNDTASAFGKDYHLSCFHCTTCSIFLRSGKVEFLQDYATGKLYCVKDYMEHVAPRCAGCEKPIESKCIKWEDGRRWHGGCFKCVLCQRSLASHTGDPLADLLTRHQEDPACRPCKERHVQEVIKRAQLDKCFRCRKLIQEEEEMFIYRLQKYHAYHFKCVTCGEQLKLNGIWDHEGKFYCEDDYIIATSPTCYSCKEVVLGRFVTGLGLTFHPEHFVCSKCQCEFVGDQFWDHEGTVLCELHYREATGAFCFYCGQVAAGSRIMEYNKFLFCNNHFLCAGCGTCLADRTFGDWDGKPMCFSCFRSLGWKMQRKLHADRKLEKKQKKGRKVRPEKKDGAAPSKN